jgi:nucleoid DNA-binding protein
MAFFFRVNKKFNEEGFEMTKRDLVIKIARGSKLTQVEVFDVIQKTLDGITGELAAGRGVEFRNFGIFKIVDREPRVGRNPQKPEETVPIPERVVVKFTPGKVLKEKTRLIDPASFK